MSPLHSFRQIHLDFHTGPDIPAIGSHFDPELFADTLQAADVNSVTLFAKCHHGHLYYETSRPERHPNLACDLLPQQITALRERGIRCPIYLSIQCDEYAASAILDRLLHHAEIIPITGRSYRLQQSARERTEMSETTPGYNEENRENAA